MAALIGVFAAPLFTFWGNATRGYIDSGSVFYWWSSQWFNPQAQTEHGLIVLLVAVWLFVRNLRRIPPQGVVPQPLTGAGIMLGALTLHGLGYLVQQTRISCVALLLFCWGWMWFAGGKGAARAAAFPLAFMLFSLPLGFLMDRIGFPLRLAVSSASVHLAHVFGIEVARTGTQLTSPDGAFAYDVAPACSGIRSLTALTALCLLLGYLSFRGLWRRLLLLALALPLAFAGNVARILAIILAGAWFGQAAGARVHEWSGFVVFLVVLGVELLVVEALRKWAPESSSPDAPPRAPMAAAASRRLTWAAAGAVLLGSVLSMGLLHRLDRTGRELPPGIRLNISGQPADLPVNLGYEWIGSAMGVSDAERAVLPPDTGFARRVYTSREGAVMLSIVLSGRDRSSIHRPEVCLVAQGWTMRNGGVTTLDLGSGRHLPVTLLSIERTSRTGRQETALFAYWFVSSDQIVATHFARMWRDIRSRLAGQSPRWAYVIAETPADDGEAAARQRLQAVIARALPEFQATPIKPSE